MNDFELQGNSLERIARYVSIEQEPKPVPSGIPPAYWPASGKLSVEKLSARYSADGPKVLEDVTFDIQSGERVGIGEFSYYAQNLAPTIFVKWEGLDQAK